ncbi:hypothetical protein BANRA_05376 [Escherichia coli]|nr:hypothetical protein BANRA_05376 [Escherichia coli]
MCVCDICAATAESQPKFLAIWPFYVKPSWSSTVAKENGCITDCRHTAWAAGIIDTAWNCERENIRNKLSSVASVSC